MKYGVKRYSITHDNLFALQLTKENSGDMNAWLKELGVTSETALDGQPSGTPTGSLRMWFGSDDNPQYVYPYDFVLTFIDDEGVRVVEVIEPDEFTNFVEVEGHKKPEEGQDFAEFLDERS